MTEQYDILQTHKQLQPALQQIADHFENTGAAKIKLQCGDVVITAEYGSTLDGLDSKNERIN